MVERSQRQRMLHAMADAVAEKGYVKTSVADVLVRAGVSRATFYTQFADKEDCFRASYESIAELLADVLERQTRSMTGGSTDWYLDVRPDDHVASDHVAGDRADGDGAGAGAESEEPDAARDQRGQRDVNDAELEADEPLAKLDRILGSYLKVLHDSPSFAKAFLIETYAAGPRAIEQRRKSLEGFVDLVAETHRGLPGLIGTAPEQRFAVQALVGAVGSLVTSMVGSGDIEGLPGLREPIMALIRQMTGDEP